MWVALSSQSSLLRGCELNTKLVSQIRGELDLLRDAPYSTADGAQAPASWTSSPYAFCSRP